MSIIELNDVRYSYKNKYRTVDAINGISCGFDSGKVYALMGRSGSGKTTLLSLIAGLDLPTSGQIICDGVPTSETDLEKYRREKVSVIYQVRIKLELVFFKGFFKGFKPHHRFF